MLIEGTDYAWAHPTPAGLAAAGKHFASRYLSYDPSKNLTSAEQQDLAEHGIAVVCNWEHTANGARGRATGVEHAREAIKQARALGMPEDRPIYFSVDWDATADELAGPVGDYFRGVASVIGVERVGVYGGYRTIASAVSARWARWYWQTYAWSGDRWHPRAHVRQYRNGVKLAGGDVDLDRAMTDDYGQWGVDDMGLTAEQELGATIEAYRVRALLQNAATVEYPKGKDGKPIRDPEPNKLYAALAAQAKVLDSLTKTLAAVLARESAPAVAMTATGEITLTPAPPTA